MTPRAKPRVMSFSAASAAHVNKKAEARIPSPYIKDENAIDTSEAGDIINEIAGNVNRKQSVNGSVDFILNFL